MIIRIIKYLVLCIIIMNLFLYSQNNTLSITRIRIDSDKIPQGFNGYKIVHLSDLHNKEFGKDNRVLILTVKMAKPDLIFITGDIINSDYYDEQSTISFVKKLTLLAPVYFVTGNHEEANYHYDSLKNSLAEIGVHMLVNKTELIEKNGDKISISGVNDPVFVSLRKNQRINDLMMEELKQLPEKGNPDRFSILLSHRPEVFELYADFGFDLIFSGHAHGGQIRLPFVGGLFAPGQGLFPKYTSGIYRHDKSAMIVSRGLGNGSSFSQRIGNYPEIVIVTLFAGKKD